MKGYFQLFIFISTLQVSLSIKCFICNSAVTDATDVKPEACVTPSKDPKFKAIECNEELMKNLNDGWMSERFNWDLHGGDPSTLQKDTTPATPDHAWKFGSEKKPGYTLKCMKEVLHKDSKDWLKHKPADFTQVVRFCEYRKDGDDCEKSCTDEQLSTGSCYICCSGDACNSAPGTNISWKSLIVAIALSGIATLF